ncbi:MAG: HEAT repeat domain-containing protein, partial [Candidatus Eremiobacteraeota bacterium]|nr:HEAT repeat domain-containing protein [Candidatus Eremiobacteraeota bacterium]
MLRAYRALGRFDLALVDFLPKTSEVHDEIYAYYQRQKANQFETWLRRNTRYLRPRLIRAARDSEEDLRALVALDWKVAEPLLQELRFCESQPYRALASSLLFQKTASPDARADLVRLAQDQTAAPLARVWAVDGLLGRPWKGRDACYLRLLADPTLRRLQSEGTAYQPLAGVKDEPEHWVPLLVSQLGNPDINVHDNAVQVLAGIPRAEALEPLLPWLYDRSWSRAEGRQELVTSLRKVHPPGAASALLHVMTHSEVEFERAEAAESLAGYPDPLHIPVIRCALERAGSSSLRPSYIEALAGNGYYSAREQAEAVLAYSK